jgi:hypothetical protein
MKVMINVTADHITTGRPGKCGKCPIALAFVEQVPKCSGVDVNYSRIAAIIDGEKYRGELPPTAVTFVDDLDFRGREAPAVKPFTFEITMIPQGKRLPC